MTLSTHRRRAQADPSRRDGPRRRRRRPRERGRPHDGSELGHARRRSTSCCAGGAGSCACRATPGGSTSSTCGRWCRRTVPGCDTAVRGVDRPRHRRQRHRRRRPCAHHPQGDRSRLAADRLPPPGPRVPARALAPGGVLERRGHTEASVDLALLAGLPPVAVICEVLHDDGSPARFPYLEHFAVEHRIAMVSVDQIAEHRLTPRRHRVPRPRAPLLL